MLLHYINHSQSLCLCNSIPGVIFMATKADPEKWNCAFCRLSIWFAAYSSSILCALLERERKKTHCTLFGVHIQCRLNYWFQNNAQWYAGLIHGPNLGCYYTGHSGIYSGHQRVTMHYLRVAYFAKESKSTIYRPQRIAIPKKSNKPSSYSKLPLDFDKFPPSLCTRPCLSRTSFSPSPSFVQMLSSPSSSAINTRGPFSQRSLQGSMKLSPNLERVSAAVSLTSSREEWQREFGRYHAHICKDLVININLPLHLNGIICPWLLKVVVTAVALCSVCLCVCVCGCGCLDVTKLHQKCFHWCNAAIIQKAWHSFHCFFQFKSLNLHWNAVRNKKKYDKDTEVT